jgi:hypothetical protein
MDRFDYNFLQELEAIESHKLYSRDRFDLTHGLQSFDDVEKSDSKPLHLRVSPLAVSNPLYLKGSSLPKIVMIQDRSYRHINRPRVHLTKAKEDHQKMVMRINEYRDSLRDNNYYASSSLSLKQPKVDVKFSTNRR